MLLLMVNEWVLDTKCKKIIRSKQGESKNKVCKGILFHIIVRGRDGGCWAVVPPAGLSFQPPRAVSTEPSGELQAASQTMWS